MDLEEGLKHKWVWKVHGRYGHSVVDQHDENQEGNATFSTVDLTVAFDSTGTATQVATAMNSAYDAGIARGRAEMLAALYEEADALGDESGAELRERLDVYMAGLL